MRLFVLFATLSLTFAFPCIVTAAPTPAIHATVAPAVRPPAVAVPKPTATPAPTATPWSNLQNPMVTFFEHGPTQWYSLVVGGQIATLNGPAFSMAVVGQPFAKVTIVKNNQTMVLSGVVVKSVSTQPTHTMLVLQYSTMTWTTP